jgi:hypothetical protein
MRKLDRDLSRRKNTALKPRPSRKKLARYLHFFLDVGTTMSDENLEKTGLNWGVVRMYDGDSDRIIATTATIGSLLKVLRALGYRGQVRAVTASSVGDLPIPSWEREIARAEQTIKKARVRRDEGALRRLASALRSAGSKPGPKRTAEYNRARIEELRMRLESMPLKQIASTYKPDIEAHAVSVRLGRFCRKVGELFVLRGKPDISAGWEEGLAEIFAKRLTFKIPDELPLIRYALHCSGVLEKPAISRQRT